MQRKKDVLLLKGNKFQVNLWVYTGQLENNGGLLLLTVAVRAVPRFYLKFDCSFVKMFHSVSDPILSPPERQRNF